MYELIYCSNANKNLTAEDISTILKTAQDFNLKNGITGCLLYHNNEFLQILEGDTKTIRALYANIEKDKRHSNVILLAESEKDERIFENWSMAYHEINNSDIKNINQTLFIDNFIALSELSKKPTHAVKLFWHMAKQILEE